MKQYRSILKPVSRKLRSDMTVAEKRLWSRLRKKQILGVTFNRQKPLAGYIVDFYCAKANLVIELDGGYHLEKEQRGYDEVRTRELVALGLCVLRFDNGQVMKELDRVIAEIYRILLQRIKSDETNRG